MTPEHQEKMKTNVAVIILTFNEEENIEQALSNVCGWAKEVFVFDSLSTDKTLQIARTFDCHIATHSFEDYGKQRNAALDELPITADWVFFLDADEWLTDELKGEIADVIRSNPREVGFYVKRRFYWMGEWVRRGYYPTWILRLFRRGKARCEARTINEHLITDGPVGRLKSDFVHEDQKSLDRWISKHNDFATREAQELLRIAEDGSQVHASFWGSQEERVRWIRTRVWNRLPPLVRPFAYFSYRTVIRGGVLDGKEAVLYHFLQALWFQLLVDAKYLEMKRRAKMGHAVEHP